MDQENLIPMDLYELEDTLRGLEDNPDSPGIKFDKVQGVWIPWQIFFNKSLSPVEKMFLGEVYNLSPRSGEGCYASNGYLGNLMGVSDKRVKNMISDLKARGYIRILEWNIRYRRMVCTLKEG